MPINRYDKPAAYQPINTYVPIPFKEIMQAGLAKEKVYADTLNKMGQYENKLASLNAIDNSVDKQYLNQSINAIHNLVNKYNTGNIDLSDAIVRQKLDNEINQVVDKTRLRDITTSYNNYLNYQKYKMQLASSGRYDPTLEYANPLNSGKPFDSRQGVFNYLPPTYLHPDQTLAKQYFAPIKGHSTTNPRTGEVFQTIDDQDVARVINENVHNILQTPEGEQGIRKYAIQKGLDYNSQNKEELARKYLYDLSRPYVGNRHIAFTPGFNTGSATTPGFGTGYSDTRSDSVTEKNQKVLKNKGDVEDKKVALQTTIDQLTHDEEFTQDPQLLKGIEYQKNLAQTELTDINYKESELVNNNINDINTTVKNIMDEKARYAIEKGWFKDRQEFDTALEVFKTNPTLRKLANRSNIAEKIKDTYGNIGVAMTRGLLKAGSIPNINNYLSAKNIELMSEGKKGLNLNDIKNTFKTVFRDINNKKGLKYSYADEDNMANFIFDTFGDIKNATKGIEKNTRKLYKSTFSGYAQGLINNPSQFHFTSSKGYTITGPDNKEYQSRVATAIKSRIQDGQLPITSLKIGNKTMNTDNIKQKLKKQLATYSLDSYEILLNPSDQNSFGNPNIRIHLKTKDTKNNDLLVTLETPMDSDFSKATIADAATTQNYAYLAYLQSVPYISKIFTTPLKLGNTRLVIPVTSDGLEPNDKNFLFNYILSRNETQPGKFDMSILDSSGVELTKRVYDNREEAAIEFNKYFGTYLANFYNK